jgi:hypothetical protein
MILRTRNISAMMFPTREQKNIPDAFPAISFALMSISFPQKSIVTEHIEPSIALPHLI